MPRGRPRAETRRAPPETEPTNAPDASNTSIEGNNAPNMRDPRRRRPVVPSAELVPPPPSIRNPNDDASDDEVETIAPIDVNGEADIPEPVGDDEEVVNDTADAASATDNAPPHPREYALIYDVRIGALFAPPPDTVYQVRHIPILFNRCREHLRTQPIPDYQFQNYVNLDPPVLLESIMRAFWEHAVHFTNLGIEQNGNKVKKVMYNELKALFGMHEVMSAWQHNPIDDSFNSTLGI